MTDTEKRAFRVRSPEAVAVWLCLFDDDDRETQVPMSRDGDDWTTNIPAAGDTRYGYRADGPPPFDPSKLLVDSYATHLDRPFAYDPRLGEHGIDTAALVPKAIITELYPSLAPKPPLFRPGGLIYEINVRGFTLLHPEVPEALRGTVGALAHPAIVAHLQKVGVDADCSIILTCAVQQKIGWRQ